MLLCIIVPVYNVELYLANCLDSLVNQDISSEDYEIIVVNDGATDSSPDIANSYQERYEQISVYHQKNQGLSAARNRGMGLAKGKYVYFIDSDDYLAYNTLGYALRLLETHDLDVLCLGVKHTKVLDIHLSDNYEVIDNEKILVTDGISYISQNHYLNNVWWYLIKRKYLETSGLTFPVGRYFEDCTFTATILSKSQRIAGSSLDFYRYVIRPESIMTKRTREHTLKQIADHEINIYEFQPLLEEIGNLSHPEAETCRSRLSARQHSFVFFMLILCIRSKLSRQEVSPILDRLQKVGAYPINEYFIRDFNNLAYRNLRFIMNRRNMLYMALRYLHSIHKVTPNIYSGVDKVVRMVSRI